MPNVFAIHSVGASLATYLRNTYPAALRGPHPCEFRLVSSGEMAGDPTSGQGNLLTLYLYRISRAEHMRAAGRANHPPDRESGLPLELHYLMTVWSGSPLAEQTILAWAMRQLHLHPVLDRSALSADGGWSDEDIVQIVPVDLRHEDTMRIWDRLEPRYRLSVGYTARVIRVDPDTFADGPPVVARRFDYSDREAVP